MKSTMPDTETNRLKLVRFVAQEVAKTARSLTSTVPRSWRFLRRPSAVPDVRGQLTLRLRELGGLIRSRVTSPGRVHPSRDREARPEREADCTILEQQVADRMIERGKEYQTFITEARSSGWSTASRSWWGKLDRGIQRDRPAHRRRGDAGASETSGRIIATGRLVRLRKRPSRTWPP